MVLNLALLHPVVISANIPLDEFIDWLSGLSGQLVIEYVLRKDDEVETLLRNKENAWSDYSRERLEAASGGHYGIVTGLPLESGNHFLHWCRRNAD